MQDLDFLELEKYIFEQNKSLKCNLKNKNRRKYFKKYKLWLALQSCFNP